MSSIRLGFPRRKFLKVPGGKHSQQACDLALPLRESKEAERLPSFHQKSRNKALPPKARLRCSTFISSLWMPLKIFVFKAWWYFKERTEWFKQNKLHYKHKALSLPSVTMINKANKPQHTCNLLKWTPALLDKAEQSQGWDSARSVMHWAAKDGRYLQSYARHSRQIIRTQATPACGCLLWTTCLTLWTRSQVRVNEKASLQLVPKSQVVLSAASQYGQSQQYPLLF